MFHEYDRRHLYDITNDNYLGLVLKVRIESILGLCKKFYVDEFEKYECSGKHPKHLCTFSFLELDQTPNTEEFKSEEEAKEHIKKRLNNENHTVWR
jgi:hypothetical protein